MDQSKTEIMEGPSEEADENDHSDPVFDQICSAISRKNSLSTNASIRSESTVGAVRIHDDYTSVPYGFQPKAAYEHHQKNSEIMGVVYNGRSKHFVILDSKGITIWAKDALDHQIMRPLTYPKYEHRLITNMIYARKYNVYFVLGKDFSLKVLNRDFEETCSVTANLRSVLFMVFNPIKDELITGGVGGTKVWLYHQAADKVWAEIKPMANYQLTLRYELPNVGGSWVKKVELDLNLQHLYFCSDTDLHAYDLDGNQIFHFERAHEMSITGCVFSAHSRLLVTASADTEVKAWSMTGGLVHTFRGHSRAITNIILHPDTSALVLTSSLDGTVRLWSLDTMDGIYCIQMSTEGVSWMGLTDDSLLYAATCRNVTVWSLNRVSQFWAMARSHITQLSLSSSKEKSTRVMAVGEDNSVRIFSRVYQRSMSTVLPPPSLTPMQRVKYVCYNRAISVVFMLLNTREIWVYTTRTDPACRMAVWDVLEIQRQILIANQQPAEDDGSPSQKPSALLLAGISHTQRATEHGTGTEVVSPCHCVCYLDSPAQVWTDEGMCCPLRQDYLLFGLEDGRVLFMDPVVKGQKYMELAASKDTIRDLYHDKVYNTLISRSNLRGCTQFQIWSLPGLDLLHQVGCPMDITGFARLDTSMVTGHQNGTVMRHELMGLWDNNFAPSWLRDDDSSVTGSEVETTEHPGPVLSVDSCPGPQLYCSCSAEGAIKIWDEERTLLTEITLDDTLTSCCFFNHRADMLVGWKNHIFFLPHNKVHPGVPLDEEEEEFETESDVYEDPAVRYEGLAENPDPVNLENYLVPYDMEFSKDFIEGKGSPVLPTEAEEVFDDQASEISQAPTTLLFSPSSTPRRLSLVDLRLSQEVHPRDLKKDFITGHLALMSVEDEELANLPELPQFGISPGPTPTPSPPSTPCTPSSFDVSDGGESTPAPSDFEDDEAPPSPKKLVEKPPKKVVKPEPVKAPAVDESQGTKSRFSGIRIDAQALIKEEAKKIVTDQVQQKASKQADHTHRRASQASDKALTEQPAKPKSDTQKASRPVAKKEFKGSRKLPKKGKATPKAPEEKAVTKQEPSPRPRTVTKPVRTRRASVRRPSTQASSEAEESLSSRRSSVDSTPVFEVPDLPPRKFGAAATPGVSTDTNATSAKRRILISDDVAAPYSRAGPPPLPDLPEDIHERTSESQDADSRVSSAGMSRVSSTGRVSSAGGVSAGSRAGSAGGASSAGRVSREGSAGRVSSAGRQSSTGRVSSAGRLSSDSREFSGGQSRSISYEGLESETPDGHAEGSLKVGFLGDEVDDDQQSQRDVAYMRATADTPASFLSESEGFIHGSVDDMATTIGTEAEPELTDLQTPLPASDAVHRDSPTSSMFRDSALPPSRGASMSLQGTTREMSASTTRSRPRSAGAQSDYESILSLFMQDSEAEADGKNFHDDRASVSFSQGPGSERPNSRWSERPMSGWSRSASRLDGQISALDMLMEEMGVCPPHSLTPDGRRRPVSAYPPSARPNTPQGVDPTKMSRPHTAGSQSSSKSLYMKFDEALRKYQAKAGIADPVKVLYQNEGTKFDNKWQDRAMERSLLMRLQKHLRAESANEKRSLLTLRKQQKQQSLLGHRNCSNTVGTLPEHASPTRKSDGTTAPPSRIYRNQDGQGGRSHTPGARSASTSRKTPVPTEQTDGVPYRHTRGEQTYQSSMHQFHKEQDSLDLQMLDPRNPMSFLYRKSPSKSIPSKCSRYILVSKGQKKSEAPSATPLEEQLIFERFPQWGGKWLAPPGQPGPQVTTQPMN